MCAGLRPPIVKALLAACPGPQSEQPALPLVRYIAAADTVAVIQRFWRLRARGTKSRDEVEDEDEDDDSHDNELWILRFAHNTVGQQTHAALMLLDGHDMVDKAQVATAIRGDRAPKGGLQRQIEALLESELPKKEKRGQGK